MCFYLSLIVAICCPYVYQGQGSINKESEILSLLDVACIFLVQRTCTVGLKCSTCSMFIDCKSCSQNHTEITSLQH